MAHADAIDADLGERSSKTVQTFKRFLVIILPALLLTLPISIYLTYNHAETATNTLRKDELVTVARGSGAVGASLRDAVGDVRYLAAFIERVLKEPETDPSKTSLLADSFRLFADTQGVYHQVRFIDTKGYEKVRVNYDGKSSTVAPHSALQFKGNRYYVRAGLDLKPGQLYISRFDLNVEHGIVEKVRQPTVRLAAPVTDVAGTRTGLAVLNVEGQDIIDLFKTATLEAKKRITLVDQFGFILNGEDKEKEWAFMFGRYELSLKELHPKAWGRIEQEGSGQFEDTAGIWTFQTVYPFEGGLSIKERSDIVPAGYNWKIISLIPHSDLVAYQWRTVRASVFVSIILVLVLTFGCWLLARSHTAVVQHGESLEKKVSERTVEMRMLNQDLNKARLKAVEGSQAKSQFLSNMSHELRTPLNAIAGFSDILAGEMLGPLGSDVYKGYAKDIGASAKHLTSIIQDLIDVSQIETDSLVLHETEAEVSVLVRDSVNTVIGKASAKQVAIRSLVSVGMPKLFVDETRIKQVLVNLLDNAVKFTPSGGVVKVRARMCDEGKIRLAVADTGVGIPALVKDRIFEPFNRGQDPLLQSAEGVGLGVAIARSLVELHDGEIFVESELNVGTTFEVIFPAYRTLD